MYSLTFIPSIYDFEEEEMNNELEYEKWLLNDVIPRDVCKLLTNMKTLTCIKTDIMDEEFLDNLIYNVIHWKDFEATDRDIKCVKSKLIKDGMIIEIGNDEESNIKRFKFVQR